MGLILIMAITFTSWTDCDWQGGYTLDWTSADTIRGEMLTPYAEAIRQALAERTGLFETAPPLPSALADPLEAGGLASSAFATAVDMYIDELLPNFVNFHDNSGEWDDMAVVGPYWTEADMLAQIGATERIYSGGYAPFSADWAHQAYQILDELRWTKTGNINVIWPSNDGITSDHYGIQRVAAAATTAQLATAWAAAAWGPTSYLPVSRMFEDSRYHTGEYHVGRQADNYYLRINLRSIRLDVDVYFRITTGPGQSVFYGDSIGITAEGNYDLGYTMTGILGNVHQNMGQMYQMDVQPAPYNDSGVRGWSYAHQDGQWAIYKWDVTGGLIFAS